ncbi:lysophospholipid acyltransferase family protein [Oribacterium sp. WCC10]|uniref:lysophospholipid acyltransferase family protein n=1 Tax=Oribacterium sp. WCC10 TaxID=1855343 RepID=UPI0008E72077|nr:lysophospholipid acyltransferase family protein [Oribacterium sp. WCC10]SFG39983.1 1-acyl-sn-glycerol-3-phosphate acyltransferase [Oribacterium sp. WCC10]
MLHTIAVLLLIVYFLTIGDLIYRGRIEKIEDRKKRAEATLPLIQGILGRILKVSGVTYEVEGMENLTNIPREEGVMFVGNHRSYYDVLIAYSILDRPTGFIAKIEMQKIKPLARWMEYGSCLMIDRDNLKQSLKVIITAVKYVKSGISIWIYPEGTRSESENEEDMLPFKEGSFKIAEKTDCWIVPVSMIHTRDILEAHFPFIKPKHVKVRVGSPIRMSELSDDVKKHVGAYTRDAVIEGIRELKAKEQTET